MYEGSPPFTLSPARRERLARARNNSRALSAGVAVVVGGVHFNLKGASQTRLLPQAVAGVAFATLWARVSNLSADCDCTVKVKVVSARVKQHGASPPEDDEDDELLPIHDVRTKESSALIGVS